MSLARSATLVFLPRIGRKYCELRKHHTMRHVEHRENGFREILAEQLVRIIAAGLAVEVGLHFRWAHARHANAMRPQLSLPRLRDPAHRPFARTVRGAARTAFHAGG